MPTFGLESPGGSPESPAHWGYQERLLLHAAGRLHENTDSRQRRALVNNINLCIAAQFWLT